MIYTNITGKFIGECMTGFGVTYPINILNSGNSENKYTFSSSNNNFQLSSDELIISNGSSGKLDILFTPRLDLNYSGYESSTIIMKSESTEDGSVDPSGDITIYVTGHRLLDTTGGHVRNFRALRNYDGDKGLSYTFYWRPPMGTGYLNNYFITGYQLEISTDNTFSSIIVSKIYEIPQNNYNPRYGSYYGFPDEDIFRTIDKYDDSTKFFLDTGYYARIYTWIDGVTGESVFATGIDSYNINVSNEVLTGNVSIKNNLVFTKKALDVYVPPKTKYINYNLYDEIISRNNNSNNFIYISGINIYFPGNTTFSSSSNNEYSLNLKGLLKNFTGDSTYGTNINFYLENTTNLISYQGAGGKLEGIINFDTKTISPENYIKSIEDKYKNNSLTCTPPKNGGSIFDFEITSTDTNQQSITDINYNIYQKFGSEIKAGGAGSKASLIVKYPSNKGSYIGYDKNNNVYNTLFYLNGNENDKSVTQININVITAQPDAIIKKDQILSSISTSSSVGFLSTWPSVYGEDAERNGGYFKLNKPIQSSNGNFVTFQNSEEKLNSDSINLTSIWAQENLFPYSYTIDKTSTIICGKFINGFANIKTKFYSFKYDLPSNFIFRFANDGITNSPVQWADTSNTAILQGSTDAGIYNNSLYSHVGKNSITLHNQQYLQYTFSSISNANMVTKKCNEFDLYMVLAYRPVNQWNPGLTTPNEYKNSKFKFLDWSLNSSNTISKQVLIKTFPVWDEVRLYRKESNVFEFLLAPLINSKFDYQNIDVSSAESNNSYVKLWDPGPFGAGFDNKYALIGKSLLNATDYYPMIVNIKRSGVIYSVFINNKLIISYDMGSFVQNASAYIISNIDTTIFKLISDCIQTNGGNKESVTYFDIVFYNKILNSDENLQINSYFTNEYFKLFTGGTSNYLDLKSNRIRLPNIFNIAGRNLL